MLTVFDYELQFLISAYNPHNVLTFGKGADFDSSFFSRYDIATEAVPAALNSITYARHEYDLIIFRDLDNDFAVVTRDRLLTEEIYRALRPDGILLYIFQDISRIPTTLEQFYELVGFHRFKVGSGGFKEIQSFFMRKQIWS